MTPSPAFVTYEIADRNELCLSVEAPGGKRVLLVPPLFDEMNRMRKLLVDVMRALGDMGVGSLLPDLPGTNESAVALERVDLADWQKAVEACARQYRISHIASFRGGALTVAKAATAKHWMFSPAIGATLLRTMLRTRIAADREAGLSTSLADLSARAADGPLELAGNFIGPDLFAALQAADIPEREGQRIVRLASDSKPCDIQLSGSALWLRAEPDDDPPLSSAIARDIASWIGQ